jgi:hypothetical protein
MARILSDIASGSITGIMFVAIVVVAWWWLPETAGMQ